MRSNRKLLGRRRQVFAQGKPTEPKAQGLPSLLPPFKNLLGETVETNQTSASSLEKIDKSADINADNSSILDNTIVESEDSQKDQKEDKKKKPTKKKHNTWWIKAGIISLCTGAFFSYLSELTAESNIVVTILVLALLIFASILADAIGTAVTSCDTTPFIAMASRKIYGAKTAISLSKHSDIVSSICNDIIGDIFGIISGSCSAAVVVKIVATMDSDDWKKWIAIIISAVVSAIMIGGKAFMKNIAIKNSKEFVMFIARILAIFSKEERANRKRAQKKKKQEKAQAKLKEEATKKDDNKA